MVTTAPTASVGVAIGVLVLLSCMLSCAGGPPVSKVHFSRSWAPASPRRHWSRPHAAPVRRVRCNRACQRERAKALPPCQQTARDAGLRCGDEMIRYSYVAASNSCVPFLYGGCRGSANNFPTFEQCRDTCKTEPEPPTTKVFGVSKVSRTGGARQWNRPGSRQDASQGSWQGFRTFRPSPRDTRVHFGIGPRRGGRRQSNQLSNRFGGFRRTSPESAGVAPRRIFFPGPIASRAPVRRQLAKSRGACFRAPRRAGWPCRDAEVRYSFIHSTNSCVPFEFRGCGGSNNNFATFSECSNLCKAPPVQGVGPRRAARRCRLPWQAGPCRGFGPMMRYFYNDQKAACELALYSGCGGNTNRFVTRHACERTCLLG